MFFKFLITTKIGASMKLKATFKTSDGRTYSKTYTGTFEEISKLVWDDAFNEGAMCTFSNDDSCYHIQDVHILDGSNEKWVLKIF